MGTKSALIVVGLALVEIALVVAAATSVSALNLILMNLVMMAFGFVYLIRSVPKAISGTANEISRPDSAPFGDTALSIAGGLLLVIPGFLTGFVGVLLLIAPLRSLFRRLLVTRLAQKIPPDLIRILSSLRNGFGGNRYGDAIDVDEVDGNSTPTAAVKLSQPELQ